MSKKRKIDFILEERDNERLIFRFYPRRSSCHSFNDELPKSWNEVYKVYYSYAIIKQWKFEPNDQWESEIMFYEDCDECSIIDGIGRICLLLADGVEVYKREDGIEIQLLNEVKMPFGMGTEWMITKHTCVVYGWNEDDEDEEETYYTFILFNWFGKGFKFTLKDNKIKLFGEYLLECCEYMLAHGDPI